MRRGYTPALLIAGAVVLTGCASTSAPDAPTGASRGESAHRTAPEPVSTPSQDEVVGPDFQAVDAERLAAECRRVFDERIEYAPKRVRDIASDGGNDDADGESDSDWEGSRSNAIEQAAYRLGAQSGMHWRYTGITELLETDAVSEVIAQTFNFSRMVSGDNVLYPVISQTRRSFAVDESGQTARSSRIAWEIIEPAQIVSAPPQWQAYLYQATESPSDPPTGLMPYDDAEMDRWREGICEGFESGVEQAETVYTDRMNRLVRDYEGMIRYRYLVRQNVVGEPTVEEGRMGIQTDPDNQRIRVDERMIRITDPAAFDPDGEAWEAIQSLAPPTTRDNPTWRGAREGANEGDADGWF